MFDGLHPPQCSVPTCIHIMRSAISYYPPPPFPLPTPLPVLRTMHGGAAKGLIQDGLGDCGTSVTGLLPLFLSATALSASVGPAVTCWQFPPVTPTSTTTTTTTTTTNHHPPLPHLLYRLANPVIWLVLGMLQAEQSAAIGTMNSKTEPHVFACRLSPAGLHCSICGEWLCVCVCVWGGGGECQCVMVGVCCVLCMCMCVGVSVYVCVEGWEIERETETERQRHRERQRDRDWVLNAQSTTEAISGLID